MRGRASIVQNAVIAAKIGEPISAGTNRAVYHHLEEVGVVIKRSLLEPPRDNVIEWTVWQMLRGSQLADTFGEIFAISESGCLLVMERLDSITPREYCLTPDIPSWLGDVKPDSFGRAASGLLKVRDYGDLKLDFSSSVRKDWQRD